MRTMTDQARAWAVRHEGGDRGPYPKELSHVVIAWVRPSHARAPGSLTRREHSQNSPKFRSCRKFNAAAVAPLAFLPRFNTIC